MTSMLAVICHKSQVIVSCKWICENIWFNSNNLLYQTTCFKVLEKNIGFKILINKFILEYIKLM